MRIGDFEISDDMPEFKEPHVLAVLRPWIDVGNVGTLSLERLGRHLQAEEMARLARPGRYYDFTRYRPRSYIEHGKRAYSIPSTVVRYAIRDEAPDLIFLHLLEPHCYGEDYTDSVMELLKFVGTRRYSLIGAVYDMVPHTRPLLVTGGSSHGQPEKEYQLVGARPSNYEGPTTITYLISQAAEALGMDTRTFVVHLPQYFQVDEDFTGTARLMEVLCSLYGLPDWLKEPERGQQQYEALQNIVTGTSEVSSLLQRLEERYDREQIQNSTTPSTPTELSPNIEEFLREFNQDFEPPEQT